MQQPENDERRLAGNEAASRRLADDIHSVAPLTDKAEVQRRAQLVLDLRRVAHRSRLRDPELSELARTLADGLDRDPVPASAVGCCGALDIGAARDAGRRGQLCSPASCLRRPGGVVA